MADKPIVTMCASDLTNTIAALSGVNKTFFVYTQNELLDKIKGIPVNSKKVNIGVIYEGMSPNMPKVSNGTQTPVVSTTVSMLVIVVAKPDTTLGAEKDVIVQTMDTIRNGLKKRKSPTGHFWLFAGESPVVEEKDVIVWVQRWQTANQV